LRVEGAFDEGQQSQLGRHLARFEFFNDVIQVFVRALCHALQVVRLGRVPLGSVVGQLVFEVGHLVALADAFPQVVGQVQLCHAIAFGCAFGNWTQPFGVGAALFRQTGAAREQDEAKAEYGE
jgi:hypothetical protein